MDSDQGKLFIGGFSWETTEEKLRDYFKTSYGEVAEIVITKDRTTGHDRCFGFVIFEDPSVADRVAGEKHIIDKRTVEVEKFVPRSNSGGGQGPATSQTRTKTIFVGGLAWIVRKDDIKKYFKQFGSIRVVAIKYFHNSRRCRDYGFITFDSEDAAENALQKSFHKLNDKMVEVTWWWTKWSRSMVKAIPKELSAGSGRATGGFGGGGGRGGGNGGDSGNDPSPGAMTLQPLVAAGGDGSARYGADASSTGYRGSENLSSADADQGTTGSGTGSPVGSGDGNGG